jgi:hypothetical protein
MKEDKMGGHVARMKAKCVNSFDRKTGRIENIIEDLGIDVRIMLKLVVNRMGECGLDSSSSGCRPVAGSCGHGSELSDSMKVGNYLTN